MWAK
jgi:hypothetical protein